MIKTQQQHHQLKVATPVIHHPDDNESNFEHAHNDNQLVHHESDRFSATGNGIENVTGNTALLRGSGTHGNAPAIAHVRKSRSVSPFSYEEAEVKKVDSGVLSEKIARRKKRNRATTDGKPSIFVSRKTRNLVIHMPNGEIYEGK